MKYPNNRQQSAMFPSEKDSIRMITEKMGLSSKEFREITNKYGVSAAQLLEIMQLSKYQFVYSDRTEGLCNPCFAPQNNLKVVNL